MGRPTTVTGVDKQWAGLVGLGNPNRDVEYTICGGYFPCNYGEEVTGWPASGRLDYRRSEHSYGGEFPS